MYAIRSYYGETVAKYAPKMLQTKIAVDKIREVIGQGGKVIQKISAECEVKIDITDDGNVFISGIDLEKANKALQIVNTIANDPEVGAIYKGKVVRLMNFRITSYNVCYTKLLRISKFKSD